MEDVSNPGAVVEETVPQQEAATPQTESAQEQPVAQAAETSQVSPDQQDKGWIKKVRRDRDEAIRRAEEAERRAKMQEELMKQLMSSQVSGQSAPVEEDILSQIQKQDYVAGETVAKAIKKQQEDFDRKLADLKKMHEQQHLLRQEAEIKSQHSDFEEVVNPDTLDMLKETNPKLYNRVANLLKVDPVDGSLYAYETIVREGIVKKMPEARREKEVERKLEQNKKTVQSPQSFDKRPLAQAMSYPSSKQERDALWKETMKYANMGGGGY